MVVDKVMSKHTFGCTFAQHNVTTHPCIQDLERSIVVEANIMHTLSTRDV